MWIFWALLSALLTASRRPIEKQAINALPRYTYGFLVMCAALPVLVTIAMISRSVINPLSLGVRYWLPLIMISVVFPPLNTFLYTHAIQKGELSKVLPLQSLLPVFSMVLAWFTLGEVPNVLAASAITLTVLGIYALGLKGKRLHHPFRPFREDSSSRAMLASVLLVTVVGIFEKMAVQASSPLFYSLSSSIGAILVLGVAILVSKQRITKATVRPFAAQITAIGTLQGAQYAAYLLAIASGPIAYVSALRGTNILMGSVLGILLFSEKLTKAKALSFLLIVAGALCLTLGS